MSKNSIPGAVKQDGQALNCASGELKTDKELVLRAVEQNGRALKFASGERKVDKEVALGAVKQCRYEPEHSS